MNMLLIDIRAAFSTSPSGSEGSVESSHSDFHGGGYSVLVLTGYFFPDNFFFILSFCISNSS